MTTINAILRDGSNVDMPGLRAYLADLQGALARANSVLATGTITALVGDRVYASQSTLYADLVPADNLFALVYADADPLKNGLYQKDGATTAGDWDGPFDLFASAAESAVQPLADAAAADALAAADSASEAAASALTTTAGINALVSTGLVVAEPAYIFGKPTTPITGLDVAPASSTFITDAVLPVGGSRYIRKLSIWANNPGNVGIVIYKRIGNTYFRRPGFAVVSLVAGLNVFYAASGQMPLLRIRDGETPAITLDVGTQATIAATSGLADDGGWYNVAGSPSSFTASGLVKSFRLEWSFEVGELPVSERRLLDSYQVRPTDVMGIVAYGQSNGGGADALPLLTTTSSLYHYTFNVGPKMTKPALSGGENPDDGLAKSLTEDGEAPIASGVYGETHLSAFVRVASQRLLARGAPFQRWFASYAGFPGIGIAGLGTGSTWYPNFTYHVETAKARMAAIGFRLNVPVVTWDHGETDQSDGMTEATYYAAANALFTDAGDDIMEITGQTFRPHWLVTVPPYHIKTSSGPTDAMIRLARERDDVHFVVPGYRIPYVNNVHLSNVGQQLKGAYYARAADQLMRGFKPDCVEWLGSYAVGSKVSVTARAPTALGWDAGETPAVADYGIVYDDSDGDPLTLSNFEWEVIGTDPSTGWPVSRLTFTTSAPAGGGQFRYAKDNQGASMWGVGGQILEGASGNIADQTAETITLGGTEYSLAHYAPPVTMIPVTLE